MLDNNMSTLGIIFPNTYDKTMSELTSNRSIASLPFASRYRVIDFMLSNMVNAGISNVSIIVKRNYHSLLDHLGNGREWDLARKKGGLNIVPPFSRDDVQVYNGRVQGLTSILGFLRSQKEEYVVMSDAFYATTMDIQKLVETHVSTNAYMTCVYKRYKLSANALTIPQEKGDPYYSYELDGDRITGMQINPKTEDYLNLAMNITVMKRTDLIQAVSDAYVAGQTHFGRDVIMPKLATERILGYEVTDYVAVIDGVKEYFDENMKLLNEQNADALFGGNRVHTKIRDDNPTRYTDTAFAKNVMAADGCVIEGKVENCILFRGVHIKKGAVVRNCVLMQDTVVGEGAVLEYVITDKNVTVSPNQDLSGTNIFPALVPKGKTV
ncbi:MAG: glucose-1-phosphate adenylyltransferase subunit GlgD [Pseudobutyrivibrio sp.]|nr:glucose-1-phosphate adenylyltransferase subunit GlgD [Pseudobutyrivibrio sp.]